MGRVTFDVRSNFLINFFRFEYKASEPIAPDQMESLEKLPVITPNTKMYFIGNEHSHPHETTSHEVISIGFTQASTRMHRLGQIPILGVGMTVRMTTSVIHKEPKTSSTREQQTPSAPSDESHETKPSNLPVPSPASSSALQRFSDRWLSSKFLENYWKSCQKLFTGMQRMGTSNLNTLPERVEK